MSDVILVIIGCSLGGLIAYIYEDRKKIQEKQQQIQKDFEELKTLLEIERYKDKEINNQRADEAEV